MVNFLAITNFHSNQDCKHGNLYQCAIQERIRTGGRVRAYNYVKLETGRNLLPVLKIVTCPAHAALT